MSISRPMAIICEHPFGGTLWLGSLFAAQDLSLLQEMGIDTVITIARGVSIRYPKEITQISFPVLDNESFPLKDYFENASILIEEKLRRGSVLVHCMAGLSRSASIILAYLIRIRQWTYSKSFNYVHERRKINPNNGFRRQLQQYSDELRRMDDKLGINLSRRKSSITLSMKLKDTIDTSTLHTENPSMILSQENTQVAKILPTQSMVHLQSNLLYGDPYAFGYLRKLSNYNKISSEPKYKRILSYREILEVDTPITQTNQRSRYITPIQ